MELLGLLPLFIVIAVLLTVIFTELVKKIDRKEDAGCVYSPVPLRHYDRCFLLQHL